MCFCDHSGGFFVCFHDRPHLCAIITVNERLPSREETAVFMVEKSTVTKPEKASFEEHQEHACSPHKNSLSIFTDKLVFIVTSKLNFIS